jgi:hypothetical protein
LHFTLHIFDGKNVALALVGVPQYAAVINSNDAAAAWQSRIPS